jgi:hypothetical protein
MAGRFEMEIIPREDGAEPSTDVAIPSAEPKYWVNQSGLDTDMLGPFIREVALALGPQIAEREATRGAKSSLFNRRGYIVSDNPYDHMRISRKAVEEDDVVGGVADVTEGLMFQTIQWESGSADDTDVFNQIAADLDLDGYLRSAARELFTCSQVVTAAWWGRKTYRVRGFAPPDKVKLEERQNPDGTTSFVPPRDPNTNQPVEPKRRGKRKRKEYTINVPTRLTILDSMKIVPIGRSLWGVDRLAWYATKEEMELWTGYTEYGTDPALGVPQQIDATMAQLVLGPYRPTQGSAEEAELLSLGIDVTKLLELNPKRVWRHTLTKSSYNRFPASRIKSVFRLLDMKQQLMDADRAMLVGAANYILLIKKGTDALPAVQSEVDNLQDNVKVLGRIPVLVGDHRLSIEIVTPKLDLTLEAAKYDTLDRRILSRLMGALTVASNGQRNESSLTVGRLVGRLLETRRHMLRRSIESDIAQAIVDANPPDTFEETPSMMFTPRTIQMDSDLAINNAIVQARTRNDLSRESYLESLGFDEDTEALRFIESEAKGYDELFASHTPFDSPDHQQPGGFPGQNDPTLQGANGAQGGRPAGGGAPPPKTKPAKKAAKKAVPSGGTT